MGATHGIGVPPPNRTAERWPVTSPCDFFTCRGIFVIWCNNYRPQSLGMAYVLCAPLGTALRFQWGWYVHTVGFTVPWVFHLFRGFHPRL